MLCACWRRERGRERERERLGEREGESAKFRRDLPLSHYSRPRDDNSSVTGDCNRIILKCVWIEGDWGGCAALHTVSVQILFLVVSVSKNGAVVLSCSRRN